MVFVYDSEHTRAQISTQAPDIIKYYVSFWFLDENISMLLKEMTLDLRLFLKTAVPRGSVNNASLAAFGLGCISS